MFGGVEIAMHETGLLEPILQDIAVLLGIGDERINKRTPQPLAAGSMDERLIEIGQHAGAIEIDRPLHVEPGIEKAKNLERETVNRGEHFANLARQSRAAAPATSPAEYAEDRAHRSNRARHRDAR